MAPITLAQEYNAFTALLIHPDRRFVHLLVHWMDFGLKCKEISLAQHSTERTRALTEIQPIAKLLVRNTHNTPASRSLPESVRLFQTALSHAPQAIRIASQVGDLILQLQAPPSFP